MLTGMRPVEGASLEEGSVEEGSGEEGSVEKASVTSVAENDKEPASSDPLLPHPHPQTPHPRAPHLNLDELLASFEFLSGGGSDYCYSKDQCSQCYPSILEPIGLLIRRKTGLPGSLLLRLGLAWPWLGSMPLAST